jgi:hypothetical protein
MTACETTAFVVLGIKVISPPSSVKVIYAWSYTSFPPRTLMAWRLIKRMDNFVFTYAVMNSEQGYVITAEKNG